MNVEDSGESGGSTSLLINQYWKCGSAEESLAVVSFAIVMQTSEKEYFFNFINSFKNCAAGRLLS